MATEPQPDSSPPKAQPAAAVGELLRGTKEEILNTPPKRDAQASECRGESENKQDRTSNITAYLLWHSLKFANRKQAAYTLCRRRKGATNPLTKQRPKN